MIEVRTLNLTLRLIENPVLFLGRAGRYCIELSGESPFNVHKSFSEQFSHDSHNLPFISLEETAIFVSETADFWQNQMNNFPKLNITGLQELTDIWAMFSVACKEYIELQNQVSVLKTQSA